MSRSNSDILTYLMGRPIAMESAYKLPKAQYGLGYRFSNPYEYSNIPVAAASAYTATNLEARGYQYREDGTQRYDDKRVNLLSGISAGMSAMSSISSAFGQHMDNKREMERLRRVRDNDYYNVPTDRYAYNSQAQNSRQNVFYQQGGMLPGFAQESTFYELPILPQKVDTSLMLTGQRMSDYQNNVDLIEDNKIKAAMLAGKANVLINYGVDYLSKPNATSRSTSGKFRYRERESGGYQYQDGGTTDQDQDQNNNDFYENYKEERFDSTTDNNTDVDPAFFLNSEPDEFDYSTYKPKLAHEHAKLPVAPILTRLKSMGLNPSSVNGGAHNRGSKHYSGRAVDLGLNTTFGGDTNKMREFKQWFEAHGKKEFPSARLVDETVRPRGQKVWSGSHYHLEI